MNRRCAKSGLSQLTSGFSRSVRTDRPRLASTSVKDFSCPATASRARIHSGAGRPLHGAGQVRSGQQDAGLLEELPDGAHHVAARQPDVVRSHLLGPVLGRRTQPADGVVVGGSRDPPGKATTPSGEDPGPVAQPGLQAGRANPAAGPRRRRSAGGAGRPFAVFKPAAGRPLKIRREGRTGVGLAEAREATGPLGEFGDQFDLNGRVERQNSNADGGTRVLAGVAENLAQQFRGTVDDAGLAGEGGVGGDEPDHLDDPA